MMYVALDSPNNSPINVQCSRAGLIMVLVMVHYSVSLINLLNDISSKWGLEGFEPHLSKGSPTGLAQN